MASAPPFDELPDAEPPMVKPELGQKRICVSCTTRFYDLAKAPTICPKCGTEQPIEQPRAPRRGGNVADERKPKKAPIPEDTDADAEPEAADDESEDGVLEDTSDLEDDADAIPDEIEVEPDADEAER